MDRSNCVASDAKLSFASVFTIVFFLLRPLMKDFMKPFADSGNFIVLIFALNDYGQYNHMPKRDLILREQ